MRVMFMDKKHNFVGFEDTNIKSVMFIGSKWIIKYNDKADHGIITGIELDAELYEPWKIEEDEA